MKTVLQCFLWLWMSFQRSENIALVISSGLSQVGIWRLHIFNRKAVLQTQGAKFERHGCLPGRDSLTKDAISIVRNVDTSVIIMDQISRSSAPVLTFLLKNLSLGSLPNPRRLHCQSASLPLVLHKRFGCCQPLKT